jgi:hypothetical protein
MADKGMEVLPSNLRNISQLHRIIENLNKRIIALENTRIIVQMEQVGQGTFNVGATSCECIITGGKQVGNI